MGGAAKGIPLKDRTPSAATPLTCPLSVLIAVCPEAWSATVRAASTMMIFDIFLPCESRYRPSSQQRARSFARGEDLFVMPDHARSLARRCGSKIRYRHAVMSHQPGIRLSE